MLVRTFKRHEEAHTVAYAMGWRLKPGTVDYRKPQVLRGDPELFDHFGRTICDYVSPHWAFALCFAEEITPAQAGRIFDRFVDAVLPGRQLGQFATLAILHSEPGKVIGGHRSAIHGFISQVDLFRGRRLQPYWDNRDRRRVELFQELVNLGHWADGPFSSAKDQSCARVVTATTKPRTVERVAQAEFFGKLLRRLSDDEKLDPTKVTAVLRAYGAREVACAPGRGRLSVSFVCEAPDGGDMPVRLVAVPRRGQALLTRSALLPILGEHFKRSPATYELLRAAFLIELAIAHQELANRHGVTRHGLDRVFDWAHGLEFAVPEKHPETAETVTKIVACAEPLFAELPRPMQPTELLAIQPLRPPQFAEPDELVPSA